MSTDHQNQGWIAKLRQEVAREGRPNWPDLLPPEQYDQYAVFGMLGGMPTDDLRWFLLLVCEAESA